MGDWKFVEVFPRDKSSFNILVEMTSVETTASRVLQKACGGRTQRQLLCGTNRRRQRMVCTYLI